MKILAFDTSNKCLTVALLDDDELLCETKINIKKNHSILLMPTIDFLMKSVELEPSDLDRIVVAKGPGSYTGLRIAVATAKTLAQTLKIDLVGVSSLNVLAMASDFSGLVIPLIDARRQTVYAGFYQNGQSVQEDTYLSLDDLLSRLVDQASIQFVGEVSAFSDKIKQELPQASLLPTLPDAADLARLGQTETPVNPFVFTPSYLKRVEAEEKWLETHKEDMSGYIKEI